MRFQIQSKFFIGFIAVNPLLPDQIGSPQLVCYFRIHLHNAGLADLIDKVMKEVLCSYC